MRTSKLEKVALTPEEFAALFGKSQTWGYRQLYAGKVKAIKDYGRLMIPVAEVERVLSEAGLYAPQRSAPKRPSKQDEKPVKKNPWKASMQSRRTTSSTYHKKQKAHRGALRVKALRARAARKINVGRTT